MAFGIQSLLACAASASPPADHQKTVSLEELIALPDATLAQVDIATMNLAAAEGLPGSEDLDRAAVLQALDAWADGVAEATVSRAHYFDLIPDYYDNSRAKFLAIMLVLTLREDMNVHYNVEQRTNPSLARSQDQFIHGIVQGTGGTCASLPVIVVAVGRRLGYPLKLVQTFSHYYARWDDPVTGEQFNIEISNLGGVDFPDEDHYREKLRLHLEDPDPGSNYLKSMTPREELSAFLTTRADCLRENGRWRQAIATYREAVRLAPQNHFAARLLRDTVRHVERGALAAEIAYRQNELRRRSNPRMIVTGIPRPPSPFPASVRAGLLDPTRFGPTPNPNPVFNAPPAVFDPRFPEQWKPPVSHTQQYIEETNRRNQELSRLIAED
ncbi:MAG: tetratricopeptide repeat protein, partial [Phycisphaerae bacterium]|nr:tetratricopeptide repeat protein [Phycisphaerae bacterium]